MAIEIVCDLCEEHYQGLGEHPLLAPKNGWTFIRFKRQLWHCCENHDEKELKVYARQNTP